MKKLKIKDWTPKQIERLPEPGYWFSFFDGSEFKLITVYSVLNGYVKYIRSDWKDISWSTLLWSCCPTKNQIKLENENENSPCKYTRYDTFEKLIEAHPEIFNMIKEKAPNDIN